MSVLPITIDEYTLLHDAYTGGGGFDSGEYLFSIAVRIWQISWLERKWRDIQTSSK